MAPQPVVTGLSPKEGPPGTRVIIRGEFLGNRPQDLVGLKICDSDCLLSAEWKSPNKIIARTGPARGKGDIIVTTVSGGVGTSTVQFRVYHETIGPLKESAVWIEESSPQNFAWGRRTLTQSGLTQEDPLGLSIEGNEQKIPEDLRDLVPDACGDLSQENFSPAWFLLENHSATSFVDLKAGLSYLKRKVESQKEGQLSFLKSNAGSVIDQLDTLMNIRDKLQEDTKLHGSEPLDVLELSIKNSIIESKKIFDDVLVRKEKADSTRAVLFALSRHKFLFCLPNAVDRLAEAGEYDKVVNDYSRAKNLFGKTEIPIFRKVLEEVDQRIMQIRKQLHEKVVKMPQRVEQQKKLIKALTSLEVQQSGTLVGDKLRNIDPAWDAIEARAKYLETTLRHTFEQYANRDAATQDKLKNRDPNQTPSRVNFCEEICDIAASQLPDLWRLGQLYFTGELRGQHDPKPGDFKRMILNAIEKFCVYLRLTILIAADQRTLRQTTGLSWPIGSNTATHQFLSWIPQCLRYTRIAYATLISLDLPSEALDIIQKLIDEVRLFCFSIIFKRATDRCKKLDAQETWEMGVEDFPGATLLPAALEALLVETLDEVQSVCMQPEAREGNLLEPQSDGQREVSQRLQEFLSAFSRVIEELAYQSHDEETPTHNVSQLLGFPNAQHTDPNVSSGHFYATGTSAVTWEQRMLCCLANYAYCNKSFFPHIGELFVKYGYPLPTLAIETSRYTVNQLFTNLLEEYVEHKGDPLVGTIEPSMYLGRFQWDHEMEIGKLRPYAHECCDNLVGVYSEIYTISPALLRPILESIVQTISEELARLMSCVRRFSFTGAIQANVDIRLLRDALENYVNETAKNYFLEALEAINPPLNAEQKRKADEILGHVKHNMRLQLLCFGVKDL
ncbi:exocyst complex component 2 [Scaptodrosophila lebanonensis]|uniref:Exocyst complex component 2 n=1 Tax=Drosophila lebanonensis TaxID=7225 RepID=A0A6J2U8X0_DROLE|nr:exocyst complex component 2 [Scaptodrosophila lebanonensis]XP_030384775.1 exocyst complex component 2 [Scaptodrosophila lebanonensis]